MLKSLTRWMLGPPALPGWAGLQAWCSEQQLLLRATRERDGFVIERPGGEPGWRIEWGPSRRAYLGAHELRLRGDAGLDPEAHAVLMPRSLMATLERDLYGQITDNVQTRLDDQTPDEVRWLAMCAKLDATRLGELQAAYAAVGNVTEWLAAWLAGPLRAALLAQAAPGPAGISVQPLFVMIAHRGGLVMRVATAAPQAEELASMLALFELARAQARRCAQVPVPPA